MSILSNLRQWHRSRQSRAIVKTLPDHILNDIGLERHGQSVRVKL